MVEKFKEEIRAMKTQLEEEKDQREKLKQSESSQQHEQEEGDMEVKMVNCIMFLFQVLQNLQPPKNTDYFSSLMSVRVTFFLPVLISELIKSQS